MQKRDRLTGEHLVCKERMIFGEDTFEVHAYPARNGDGGRVTVHVSGYKEVTLDFTLDDFTYTHVLRELRACNTDRHVLRVLKDYEAGNYFHAPRWWEAQRPPPAMAMRLYWV